MRASLIRTGLLRSLILMISALGLSQPAWSKAPESIWVPSWYSSPTPSGKAPDAAVTDITLRQVVRISAGGTQIRLRLSNAYGTQPLRFDDVRAARRLTGSRIEIASNTNVTFQGQTGVTIPPGTYALSDPIALTVTNNADLAVSLFIPKTTKFETSHGIQRGAIYVTSGKATELESFPTTNLATPIDGACPWLVEVEVAGSTATRAIVAFGDSITDGHGITPDKGGTWPEVLSRRLNEAGMDLSVINAGISGNRLLHHGQWSGFGEGALARFDRDVLAQPNVSHVIVLIGINDLGHAKDETAPEYVSANEIIWALSQLAERAHEKGIVIYAGTLLPFKDTTFTDYYSDAKEAQRVLVNAWIRETKVFDGVIDFDKLMEDPKKPGYLQKKLDVGDHLHPNSAGAAVMGNAIPLELFSAPKPAQ